MKELNILLLSRWARTFKVQMRGGLIEILMLTWLAWLAARLRRTLIRPLAVSS